MSSTLKINLIFDRSSKKSSVKGILCLSYCERAVTNNINVTSYVDKQCISFKASQIKTVAQFGIILKCFCLPASFFESLEQINYIFCLLFQTLELLYRITNGQNVVVIVQKMLDYLKESKEEYAIINLVGKIAELAEKYPFIFLKLWDQSSGKRSICTFQSILHDLLK